MLKLLEAQRDEMFKKIGQYMLQVFINDDEEIKNVYQSNINTLLIRQKELCEKILKMKGKIC